ncbi:MAG: helix-turn-helix domain-containing protein [Gemmatimonadota bacterium]|nr:helix-turn-helix domain-containing protein [Gemmatimonadota bacterium]
MTSLLDFSKPHVLRNETEYDAAVREIDGLLDADPEPGSDEYERLEFLSVLVQAFEDVRFPIDETMEPSEIVEFMLEQKGLSRTDLAEWLGGRSRVSEFYNGKRSLSIRQIRRLTENLGIPADLLITRDGKR